MKAFFRIAAKTLANVVAVLGLTYLISNALYLSTTIDLWMTDLNYTDFWFWVKGVFGIQAPEDEEDFLLFALIVFSLFISILVVVGANLMIQTWLRRRRAGALRDAAAPGRGGGHVEPL